MNLQDFLSMLDMDKADQFEYFEQLADIIECDEEFPEEFMEQALSAVESDTIAELITNYFEELTNALPDEEAEVFSLIEATSHNIVDICKNLDYPGARKDLSEALFAFRSWYKNPELAMVDGARCSVFDAVTRHREEVLGGAAASYDFQKAISAMETSEVSIDLGKFKKIEL